MAELRRVPAGRAGRLWLRRRLAVAHRAVDLLDQQLRLLRREQERLALLAEETGKVWRERCREAETWLLRGAVIGGEREIRLATEPTLAQLDLTWSGVMGVRYPGEATLRPPEPSASARAPGNAGLVLAIPAYREALRAAVRHAAADAALRIVTAEIAEVRRRMRAISERWAPRLDRALRELTQRLEEQERDQTVRLRWAAARQGGRR